MNATIHPRSYATTVRCSNCGTEHDLRSTREDLRIDVCSSCHPFFTGKQKLIDSAGRVERFNRKFAKTTAKKAAAQA